MGRDYSTSATFFFLAASVLSFEGPNDIRGLGAEAIDRLDGFGTDWHVDCRRG